MKKSREIKDTIGTNQKQYWKFSYSPCYVGHVAPISYRYSRKLEDTAHWAVVWFWAVGLLKLNSSSIQSFGHYYENKPLCDSMNSNTLNVTFFSKEMNITLKTLTIHTCSNVTIVQNWRKMHHSTKTSTVFCYFMPRLLFLCVFTTNFHLLETNLA